MIYKDLNQLLISLCIFVGYPIFNRLTLYWNVQIFWNNVEATYNKRISLIPTLYNSIAVVHNNELVCINVDSTHYGPGITSHRGPFGVKANTDKS